MAKDFFDDFEAKKIVLSSSCMTRLNEMLQQLVTDGSSPEAGQAKYVELLQQLVAAQGATLEDAIRDNPGFIYLESATDPQQFNELLAQTAAAAAVASKAAAAAAAAAAEGEEVAGTWEPPPADVHPETEEDYA